jgi:acyl-CoA synthetase (AMP-forming)/AMP-acid ligase II
MNTLKSSLLDVPFDRDCLIANNILIKYGELHNIVEINKSTINKLYSSNVVINARSRFEFAKLLIILDGEVNNILFLPQDIDKSLHDRYYEEANINYEVYLEEDILQYSIINESIDSKNIEETNWIIPTSGTTNIPKLVSHTFNSLTRTTKRNIELGIKYRWGLVFDIYRFSGIQVFLQAMLSGSTLIIAESNMSISETVNNLVSNKCNALSGTASFWRKILMSKESNRLNLDVITLGGEIADENILQALKTRFPNAKITHIYASTEAGVGFSVNDGHSGFPIDYLKNGVNGISIKISDKNTLMIKSEKQNQKYIGNNKLFESDGFIDTGDIVEIKNSRVYFLGRDSGSINVGGNKVQPEEVEQILLSSELIYSAYVYPKKNPMMGNIVCADVVLKDKSVDKQAIKLELLKYCREKLENFKVPAILKFVDELEITQSGKLKRN